MKAANLVRFIGKDNCERSAVVLVDCSSARLNDPDAILAAEAFLAAAKEAAEEVEARQYVEVIACGKRRVKRDGSEIQRWVDGHWKADSANHYLTFFRAGLAAHGLEGGKP